MKLQFYFIIFILCLSCNQTTKQERAIISNNSSIAESNKSISAVIEETDELGDEEIIQDCIFDQTTQTDEFLKEIKELEGYIWDPETKTAEIVLNDHWFLTLRRGGCNHFEMSASFAYDRILNIEKDKKQIFDQVIWITSLLDGFDGDGIKKVIDKNKVVIIKDDDFNSHANFMDEELYELYYFTFNNKNKTTFEIGYYYN